MKALVFASVTHQSPDKEKKRLLEDILKKEKSNESLEYYEKELEKNPQNHMIWYQKGGVLLRDLKFAEALESFDRALSLNPAFMEAWFQKGNACYFQNKYREAMMCYNRAELFKSDDPLLLFMQVCVYFELGIMEKCVVAIKKSIKILSEKQASESLSLNVSLLRLILRLSNIFKKYQ